MDIEHEYLSITIFDYDISILLQGLTQRIATPSTAKVKGVCCDFLVLCFLTTTIPRLI
jgi:hypothetical protein